MEISGKGLLHFYQDTSYLMGNQANHRTNIVMPYEFNSRYESDYECICIVSNGKTCSVPLNILSSVFLSLRSWQTANPLYATFQLYLHCLPKYSKTCLKRSHSKIDKTEALKTNSSLMKVESIAECSPRAFCSIFDLH